MSKKLDNLLEEEKSKLEDSLVESTSEVETETKTEDVIAPEVVAEEAATVAAAPELTFDVATDIDAIFSGMDVSEDFKAKAGRIYEASVRALATSAIDEAVTKINEEYEEAFTLAVEEYESELNEQVAGFLDMTTEKWIAENAVEAKNVVRAEIAESFMLQIKQVLEDHYVDLPDDKIDIAEEMQKEIDTLTEKQNALLEDLVAARKEAAALVRGQIVREQAEGLTDVEKDKFGKLSEAIEYASPEEYTERLSEIRESYFSEEVKTESNFESADPIELEEEFVRQVEAPKFNVGPVLAHLGRGKLPRS